MTSLLFLVVEISLLTKSSNEIRVKIWFPGENRFPFIALLEVENILPVIAWDSVKS